MQVRLPPDDGQIVHRLDGWTVNGHDDMHMPANVSREIARNMPHPLPPFEAGYHPRNFHSDIRARMRCRGRMVERMGRLIDG
jgi:hypothetical protein